MKLRYIILLLLALPLWVVAQNSPNWHYYSGEVGGSRVYVKLDFSNRKPFDQDTVPIHGKYFYEKYRTEIELKGWDYRNEIFLEEFSNGEVTARFRGYVGEDLGISGTWMREGSKMEELHFEWKKKWDGSYAAALDGRDITDITDDDFKSILSGFPQWNLPDTLSAENEEIPIEGAVFDFLFPGIEKEPFGMESWYAQGIIFQPGYIAVVSTRFFTPGAFGVYNTFVELSTWSYKGNLRKREEIACFCFDNNFADFYSTSPVITFETTSDPAGMLTVTIVSTRTHASNDTGEDSTGGFEFNTMESKTLHLNERGEW